MSQEENKSKKSGKGEQERQRQAENDVLKEILEPKRKKRLARMIKTTWHK